MLPKWSQKGSTWSQQGPKWNQKGRTLPKMALKGDQKTSKNPWPKKGRFQDALGQSAGNPFGAFLVENEVPSVAFGTPGKSKIGPKAHF